MDLLLVNAKTNMTGYHANIEQETLANTNFRKVLFTGAHSQLVVMCLQPNEDIGTEVHPNVDQFFRFEEGEGKAILNGEEITFKADDVLIVPAGIEHNIINTSLTSALKLYTIYSPANHPDGTIHTTKAEAIAAEAGHHQ
jgi:mannose-6-phosphate isomerase-like protein (cupin superfamily)